VQTVTSYLQVAEYDRIASLLSFRIDYGFNEPFCCVGILCIPTRVESTDSTTHRRHDTLTVDYRATCWTRRFGGFKTHGPVR
jgi:hypothetical protein